MHKETTKGLISVIIPCHNSIKYFPKAYKSIKNQTYKKYEIIVVDDSKNSLLFKYIKSINDKSIKYYKTKANSAAGLRNIGIKKSRGEYIYFMDVDDRIDPNLFNECIKTIDENNTNIVIFAYTEQYGNHKTTKLLPWKDGLIHKDDITKSYIPNMILGKNMDTIWGTVWRMVITKNTLIDNNLLFDEDLTLSEDLVFTTKLLATQENIYILNEPLYTYIRRDDSISTRFNVNFIHIIIKSSDRYRECLMNCGLYNQNKERYAKNRKYAYVSALNNLSNTNNNKEALRAFEITRDIYKNDRILNTTNPKIHVIAELELLLLRLNMYRIYKLISDMKKILRHSVKSI